MANIESRRLPRIARSFNEDHLHYRLSLTNSVRLSKCSLVTNCNLQAETDQLIEYSVLASSSGASF